jgi:hypothetical protein
VSAHGIYTFHLFVIFCQVKGIPGTYISNQYFVPDPMGNEVSERTFITFDKGGNWRLLDPPADLKPGCKNPQVGKYFEFDEEFRVNL